MCKSSMRLPRSPDHAATCPDDPGDGVGSEARGGAKQSKAHSQSILQMQDGQR